jgi:hypothetical protein
MFPTTLVPSDKQEFQKFLNDWGEAIVGARDGDRANQFGRLFSNRQMYRGQLNVSELKYVSEQFGLRTPARLVGYPFLFSIVEELVGETSKDSLDFSIEGLDDEIIAAKLEKKVAAATKVLTAPIRKILGGISEQELFEQDTDDELPDNVKAFDEMNFHHHLEMGMLYALKHLQQKYSWDLLFTEGMREMAINYRQIYRVEVVNGDPQPFIIDPSCITFGGNDREPWLHKKSWVREERKTPIYQVIDEYRHLADKPTVDKWIKWAQAGSGVGQLNGSDKFPAHYGEWDPVDNELYLHVIRYQWRAIEFLNVKQSENKWDPARPFIKFVDSPKDADGVKPFNTSFQGVWIAGCHYDQRKRPNQTRDNEDYAVSHLGYFGCVRDQISVVDATKNIFLMLCITMYHIEAMLNRVGGKAVVYDIAQKPKKIPLKDIFYHAKESGMILINSSEENFIPGRGFNQFQQIDFTLSNAIEQLFKLKAVLEDTLNQLTGVSPNRMGQGRHDETVSNNKQKITQSTFITQSLFDDHFQVIEDVMNEVLNLIRIAWADDSERILTVMGDRGREMMKFMRDGIGHHYGLFVKNSMKERGKKEFIMGLGERALASGQASLLDVLKMSNKSTSREVERTFTNAVRVMQEQQQAGAQAQNQLKQQELKLKQSEIQSRIIAARIEAGAYVETKRLEISAKYGLESEKNMTQLGIVAKESNATLDKITTEAMLEAQRDTSPAQGGQPPAEG